MGALTSFFGPKPVALVEMGDPEVVGKLDGASTAILEIWDQCAAELERRGYEVRRFIRKDAIDGKVQFSKDVPLVAGRRALKVALQQLGALPEDADLPERGDYPESLRPFLGRRVWPSTVGEARRLPADQYPVFLKPRGAAQIKRWNGFVYQGGPGTDWELEMRDKWKKKVGDPEFDAAECWLSERVAWASEFRVYIMNGEILGKGCYKGAGDSCPIDMEVVKRAVKAYEDSGEAVSAYVLDFGAAMAGEARQLDELQTLFIEAGDAYGFGCYKPFPISKYVDMCLARYFELANSGAKEGAATDEKKSEDD